MRSVAVCFLYANSISNQSYVLSGALSNLGQAYKSRLTVAAKSVIPIVLTGKLTPDLITYDSNEARLGYSD
jgi:hypothetical protein